MSDQTDDRGGAGDEVTETTGEQQVGAWSSPAPGPRWSEIASEAGSSTAEQPTTEHSVVGSDPSTQASGAETPGPATEAGRARRPSSLRTGPAASAYVPPPKPSRPAFPRIEPSEPTSDPGPAVSESAQTGRSGQVSGSATTLVEKIPIGELQDLVKKRPEVGLGIAFAGGLVIATILKRLGRR